MATQRALRVTMIGSLPPHKGVSPYVMDLCTAIAARDDIELDVVAFHSLYPRALYAGGDPEDGSRGRPDVAGAQTRRPLRWWNPFGWLLAGLTLRGDLVHAQWWSYPLAPVYVVLLGCARLRGKRVVITMHNVEPHERGLLRRLANMVVLPFAHRIIVHSADNARTLHRYGHRMPVDVFDAGYGGKCLPKDSKSLLDLARSVGIELEVLRATDRTNAALRGDEAAPARLARLAPIDLIDADERAA